jgi:hypothetical protein
MFCSLVKHSLYQDALNRGETDCITKTGTTFEDYA